MILWQATARFRITSGLMGRRSRLRGLRAASAALALGLALAPVTMVVQGGQAVAAESSFALTGFKTAVAEAASGNRDLAAYYRARDFAPIWTGAGPEFTARRAALLEAIRMMPVHGLPAHKYSVDDLVAQMGAAVSDRDLGLLDVELSQVLLEVGRDLQTGILVPGDVDKEILRVVPLRDASQYLDGIAGADPMEFIRSLPPHNAEYRRLLRAKIDMEQGLSAGGYGPQVQATKLEPGAQGRAVIQLRDRLVRMGYMAPRAVSGYDEVMVAAVRQFQDDSGIEVDGVVGPSTLAAINTSEEDRLKSILVAMERERWLNRPRGERHIWVNLTDFHAKLIDHDEVVFETRSVIGANRDGRRSPEFSDVMEYMMINPTWNVPRSIAVKEYLPELQKNPYAASQLNLIDSRGRVVPRDAVDFSQLTPSNFPFDLKEPPSQSNALGLVKFMFPNPNNIYLHDTPSKSLFNREVRAFSHGCIRLADPFDFAYALLSAQEADPKAFFQAKLSTGRETQVNLAQPLQVHLVYRTAFTDVRGKVHFRNDVYGRDARIWSALEAEGVVLGQGRS